MSKSDWWSISAALAVAGCGYFINARVTAISSLVGAAGIALVLLFWPKKKESAPDLSATSTATANPSIAAKSNASVGDININVGHQPAPNPQPPGPVIPTRPPPEPNLQLQSFHFVDVGGILSDGGSFYGYTIGEPAGRRAAVVCIKNKSLPTPIANISHVRAALTFRNESGQEIGQGISRGCWLNIGLKNADFNIEETRCVILLIDSQAGLVCPELVTATSRFENGIAVAARRFPVLPDTVELILVKDSKRVFGPVVFEISFDPENELIQIRDPNDEQHLV